MSTSTSDVSSVDITEKWVKDTCIAQVEGPTFVSQMTKATIVSNTDAALRTEDTTSLKSLHQKSNKLNNVVTPQIKIKVRQHHLKISHHIF